MAEQGTTSIGTPQGSEQRASSVEDFINRYADALIAGDGRTIAAMWESPALVLADSGVTYVSSAFEVERFFTSAKDQYFARGVVSAHPEIVREDWATPRIVVVDALWHNLDSRGAEVAREASTYMLRRSDEGELKLHVVLIRSSPDRH
jgi:ketosteroid isomerase-like protein